MTIKQILEEYKINIYQLCVKSGVSVSQHARIKKSVNGDKGMAYHTLEKLCHGLSTITNKPITPSEIEFEIKEVKLK